MVKNRIMSNTETKKKFISEKINEIKLTFQAWEQLQGIDTPKEKHRQLVNELLSYLQDILCIISIGEQRVIDTPSITIGDITIVSNTNITNNIFKANKLNYEKTHRSIENFIVKDVSPTLKIGLGETPDIKEPNMQQVYQFISSVTNNKVFVEEFQEKILTPLIVDLKHSSREYNIKNIKITLEEMFSIIRERKGLANILIQFLLNVVFNQNIKVKKTFFFQSITNQFIQCFATHLGSKKFNQLSKIKFNKSEPIDKTETDQDAFTVKLGSYLLKIIITTFCHKDMITEESKDYLLKDYKSIFEGFLIYKETTEKNQKFIQFKFKSKLDNLLLEFYRENSTETFAGLPPSLIPPMYAAKNSKINFKTKEGMYFGQYFGPSFKQIPLIKDTEANKVTITKKSNFLDAHKLITHVALKINEDLLDYLNKNNYFNELEEKIKNLNNNKKEFRSLLDTKTNKTKALAELYPLLALKFIYHPYIKRKASLKIIHTIKNNKYIQFKEKLENFLIKDEEALNVLEVTNLIDLEFLERNKEHLLKTIQKEETKENKEEIEKLKIELQKLEFTIKLYQDDTKFFYPFIINIFLEAYIQYFVQTESKLLPNLILYKNIIKQDWVCKTYYNTVFFDYRLRMYYNTTMSPTHNKLIRKLQYFKNTCVMNEKNINHFKISASKSHIGGKKAAWEYIQHFDTVLAPLIEYKNWQTWIDTNKEKIEDFIYLAGHFIEYEKYLKACKNNEQFETGFPLQQDMIASGYTIEALLLRDKNLLAELNISESTEKDTPKDFYMKILLDILQKETTREDLGLKLKELLKVYNTPLGYSFLRKIYKVPLMCILYSLTFTGFNKHIEENLLEALEEPKFFQFTYLEEIISDDLISLHMWEVLHNLKIFRLLTFLQKMYDLINPSSIKHSKKLQESLLNEESDDDKNLPNKNINEKFKIKPIYIETPKARHCFQVLKTEDFIHYGINKRKNTIRRSIKNEINNYKTKLALIPNIFHTLDAYILNQFFIDFNEEFNKDPKNTGIAPLVGIMDCAITTVDNIEKVKKVMSQVLYKVFTDEITLDYLIKQLIALVPSPRRAIANNLVKEYVDLDEIDKNKNNLSVLSKIPYYIMTF